MRLKQNKKIVTCVMLCLMLGLNTVTVSASQKDEDDATIEDTNLSESLEDETEQNVSAQARILSVESLRGQFTLVVKGGRTLGYTTAATFLEHSLQDNPCDLIYGTASTYANQIYNSNEFKAIILAFKGKVKGTSLIEYYGQGSVTLQSSMDLKLAYNKVDYIVEGRKNNGTWTVTVKIIDEYDFDAETWQEIGTYPSWMSIINNYAVIAENMGAIVPYDICVTIQYKYTSL